MVLTGYLQYEKETAFLDSLEEHINTITLSKTNTYHSYEKELPTLLKINIGVLKYGEIMRTLLISSIIFEKSEMINNYDVDTIDGMNEVYVASMGAKGSDKVFETDHIDGPFFFLPFCTVYRVVVGVSKNNYVYTKFPILKDEIKIDKYHFAAFDYNKDIHSVYIKDPLEYNENEKRIVLKLHYIKYWKYLPRQIVIFYKYIHVAYNSIMRNMFLYSQLSSSPNNRKWLPWLVATIINGGTIFYCGLSSMTFSNRH